MIYFEINEFAKLRALRAFAPYVPSRVRALLAFASYVTYAPYVPPWLSHLWASRALFTRLIYASCASFLWVLKCF